MRATAEPNPLRAFEKGKRKGSLLAVFLLAALVGALAVTKSVFAAPGDLDSSFGNGGKVITNLYGGPDKYSSEFATSVAVQPDSKIVAGGFIKVFENVEDRDPEEFYEPDEDFLLVRYDTDGTLDTSFGQGGQVTTDFVSDYDNRVSGLAIQPDGKLVVAGYSFLSGGDFTINLARYNPDGNLDTSFGTGGKVLYDGVDTSRGYAIDKSTVAFQADGKIIFNAGTQLFRYNADGTPDTAFGQGGQVTADFGSDSDSVAFDSFTALAVRPDGKIIVSGNSHSSQSGNPAIANLVRYNPDGSLDTFFGTGGKVSIADKSVMESVNTLTLQPDGKIVAAGYNNDGSKSNFALARYNSDGSPDDAFGTGGKVTTDLGDPPYSLINALVVQKNGKLVAGGLGHAADGSDGFALARYNPDGSLDTSFGTEGKIITLFNIGDDVLCCDLISGLALQPDGKIIAAGFASSDVFFGVTDIVLARYEGEDLTDNTKPTLNLPSDLTQQATDANGATVTYEATAADDVDGNVSVTCDPASGGTFPIGETTVACSATDAAGNRADGSFKVNVVFDNINQEVGAGGTVSTANPNGGLPTASDPVATYVTSPIAGAVSIGESPDITYTPIIPGLFGFYWQQVDIDVPGASTWDKPYKLEFRVYPTSPSITDANAVQLFRNGERLPNCTGSSGTAYPDPCVSDRVLTSDGILEITAYTSEASTWNLGLLLNQDQPLYDNFKGFFQPVDNPTTLNTVKAGSAVPVKFSLGGDKGLSIFADGYPRTRSISCDSQAPTDAIEQTVSATSSKLTYDASTGQYNYVWKTDKSWTGCRQLVILLKDGSVHRANFKFR